jgi:hypothetical protein
MSLPPLPEAAALAGAWTLEAPDAARGGCRLVLGAGSAAAGYALDLSPACRETFALQAVTAWRPAPDGVEFARADRLTVAFFAREAEGTYVARRDGRPVMVLRRARGAG